MSKPIEVICRSCGNTALKEILSLGSTPLANALLTKEQLRQREKTYPLDLVLCPSCALVQITETVPPEELFSDYFYFSSFADSTLASAKELAERLIHEQVLSDKSLVIEIASNDGYLLKNYQAHGIPILGVEPARNIAKTANARGISTLVEFFNVALAEKLVANGNAADVIHAHNVIAHVANLHDVVEGIKMLLKPNGLAVIENHYVKDLIDKTAFDSIYHEHLCYYSLTSFENLFAQHGLSLVDVEHIPVHGGSLRVYFQREDGLRNREKEGAARVAHLLREEKKWGVDDFNFYRMFGTKVEKLKTDLTNLLERLRDENKRIVVYGASAKSTTLLNYFAIGNETIEYVVDRSTEKQGRFTPGTHLPIFPPRKLLEDQPEYTLLLSWNFEDEVLEQQKEYRHLGGRFIIPIPELRIV